MATRLSRVFRDAVLGGGVRSRALLSSSPSAPPPGPSSSSSSASAAVPPASLRLNFDEPRHAMALRSTGELWRAYFVFRVCGMQWLVRNARPLVRLSTKVLGVGVTRFFLKHTFFAHFCAGEDGVSIAPTLNRLAAANIGPILDYAAEAESANPSDRTGIVSARVFDYDGEDECEANCEVFRKCIEAAAQKPNGFAAIKLTALGNVAALEQASNILHATRRTSGSSDEVSPAQLAERLSSTESKQMELMVARLERLCEFAASKGVRLMIDAEQTYYQPAIDHMCRQMQRKHNRSRAIIYNTYQCYLKDSHARILLDLERARRDGFVFAAKLVRGAYMVQERRRASVRGYPDPIYGSIAETHSNYHVCLDSIMEHIPRTGAEVMVASHNETSIRFAVDRMQHYGIDPRRPSVVFGQLLGMCDHVSFTLGLAGYSVYKYVPYGPVMMVLPYLLRRLEENSDMLGGAAKERRLIWAELKRRWFVRAAPPPAATA